MGKHFGTGESGVSQACRRGAQKVGRDKKLRTRIGKIEMKLKLSEMKTLPLWTNFGALNLTLLFSNPMLNVLGKEIGSFL